MENLPKSVQIVLRRLEEDGREAWCVGGCVRDSLLGRTPEDWDVTTSALPEQIMELFGTQARPTGLQHGTVSVTLEGETVEVTTFRVDGTYHDHRRPDQVTFTRSLEEDLRRRDFTINAMALNLRGELRDPFCGQSDLTAGVLRCVGEPERRFEEDALRILRGMRFASVLGLRVEEATAMGIHRCAPLLAQIAPERIAKELMGLLVGARADAVLREYPDVIGVFWPEILPMVGFDQRNRHHCYDVWEHTLHALSDTPPDPIVRCVMLLHDIGKPKTFTLDAEGHGHFRGHPLVSRDLAEEMLCRLKCSNAFRQTVTRLVEWHDRGICQNERTLRRALYSLGEQDLKRLLVIKRADNLAQAPAFQQRQAELDWAEKELTRLLEERACMSLRDLAVNGKDLTGMGLRGPEVGAMLETLLSRVVDGELPNEPAVLLDTARQLQAYALARKDQILEGK